MQAPPSSSKEKSIMPSSSASLFPMEAEGGVKIPWQMIEINGGAGSVGDGAWWRRRVRKGGKNDNNNKSGGGDGTIKKKRKPSNIIDPPRGKPICEICHKEFSGWKAAFGHMRAHPNRGYRGFFKPPDFSSSSSQQLPTQHHQTQPQLGEPSRDPRDRGFDLNQLPMEEDEENNKNQHDFDLNQLPIDKP